MRSLIIVVLGGVLGFFVTGCDWTSSGSDGGWSSSYDGVNFSGVYRSSGGSAVGSSAQLIPDETFAVGDGRSTSYGGQLANRPIVPGSLTVSYTGRGGQTFSDQGDGQLAGTAGGSGTVDYESGRISIRTTDLVERDVPIRATYRVSQNVDTLNVTQTGQHLTIIASNGAEFSGKMGGLSTSGVDEGTEEAIAEFSASAEYGGQKIRLVGTFRSLLVVNAADSDTESAEMTQRAISATWIEQGTGISLDVNGFTGNTSVTLTP